jgi:opacity protein-like surface antigen
MKRTLILGLGLASLTMLPAAAADLPVKAPIIAPVAASAVNWSGCYVGANAGWIGGRTSYDTSPSVPT